MARLNIREELSGRALMLESDYNKKMEELDKQMAAEAKTKVTATMHKGKRGSKHTYKSGPKAGKTEYKLGKRIKPSLLLASGNVSGVGLKIERHGIFQEYGVSNKHPKSGPLRAQNHWLSTTLDATAPKLAEVAAEYYSDLYVKNLKFNFKE